MTKEKNSTITDATFLSRSGSVINVKDVVTEKECWYVEKEHRYVLAHRAIQKIAALAGISKNYEVTESPLIQPSYKNELEHIVRVTIHCTAKVKGQKKGCCHDPIEHELTVTGEANKTNTPVRGRGYLRKMAEKRAFDIAVLEHIGLYDTTFSEEESETMIGNSPGAFQNAQISNVELEALKEEINALVASDTADKLEVAKKSIDEKNKAKKFNDNQFKYLQTLIADRQMSIGTINKEDRPF